MSDGTRTPEDGFSLMDRARQSSGLFAIALASTGAQATALAAAQLERAIQAVRDANLTPGDVVYHPDPAVRVISLDGYAVVMYPDEAEMRLHSRLAGIELPRAFEHEPEERHKPTPINRQQGHPARPRRQRW